MSCSIRDSQVRVMVGANERQVGGEHYKDTAAPCPRCGSLLEHWDVSWAFGFNQFQYCISKYIWRKKGPGGRPLLDDLEKAKHHLEKYIECVKQDEDVAAGYGPDVNMAKCELDDTGEPGPDYVNQD